MCIYLGQLEGLHGQGGGLGKLGVSKGQPGQAVQGREMGSVFRGLVLVGPGVKRTHTRREVKVQMVGRCGRHIKF